MRITLFAKSRYFFSPTEQAKVEFFTFPQIPVAL